MYMQLDLMVEVEKPLNNFRHSHVHILHVLYAYKNTSKLIIMFPSQNNNYQYNYTRQCGSSLYGQGSTKMFYKKWEQYK